MSGEPNDCETGENPPVGEIPAVTTTAGMLAGIFDATELYRSLSDAAAKAKADVSSK